MSIYANELSSNDEDCQKTKKTVRRLKASVKTTTEGEKLMHRGLLVILPLGGLFLLFFLISAPYAQAWDGFDADTAAFIEVEPTRVPSAGDIVTVSHYKSDVRKTCLVEEVRHNLHTLELVVRCPAPDGRRTLVMERM